MADKRDATLLGAVDMARQAAVELAGDWGVGDWLGAEAEAELELTHYFDCLHAGYVGWRWTVPVMRVPRARTATVAEVTLTPGPNALLAPKWVPWSDRLMAGDLRPGMVLPTSPDDPRLVPGYTGGELAARDDPAEWSMTRAIVAELGLGRERVLSAYGREEAAERWLKQAGPGDPSTRQAPGDCVACGYFVRLSGAMGNLFGVCANEYSPFDGHVVAVDHGCGGHSDVTADTTDFAMTEPVFDTITLDHPIFD